MKYLIFLLVFVGFVGTISAQSFKKDFEKAFTNGDTVGQYSVLNKWHSQYPDDPEYYTAAFNYYAAKSKLSGIGITNRESEYQIRDSSNKVLGYLNEETVFAPDILNEGFRIIDNGIKKFPSRLDMRFGKAYMLKESGQYDLLIKEITNAILYSKTINNKWLWTNSKFVDDPENYFLNNIHSYVAQLYEIGDEQAERMKIIAETALKYYPSNVELLSDLAILILL